MMELIFFLRKKNAILGISISNINQIPKQIHCVKYARIWVFSDSYFPDSVLIGENTGQKTTRFWHSLRGGRQQKRKNDSSI